MPYLDPHQPNDEEKARSVAAQLYESCTLLYRRVIQQFCATNAVELGYITKEQLMRLRRNYEELALWGHSLNIAHGGLDEALARSPLWRRSYFQLLLRISTTLLRKLLPLYPFIDAQNHVETLEACLEQRQCLAETHRGNDSDDDDDYCYSASDPDDSIGDIIEELEADLEAVVLCVFEPLSNRLDELRPVVESDPVE